MNKITLIQKIRKIIEKGNDEAAAKGLLYTLAPAKEIADLLDTLSKPSEKCCCGEVDLEIGTAKEVDNVVHRKNNPCFINALSKPSVVSVEEITEKVFFAMRGTYATEHGKKIEETGGQVILTIYGHGEEEIAKNIAQAIHNLIMKGL